MEPLCLSCICLGGLFSWLAIRSFGAAFGSNEEDEHVLLAEDESDFEEDEEDWDDGLEDDLEEEEERWRGEPENEWESDWCPEELSERGE